MSTTTTTSTTTTNQNPTRVCVIGAGPSGLAQLRAFQSAASNGISIPQVVCFERQSDWGGLWNYTWRTGLDENGEPVHSGMYRYLWSNGPKECLEFADYSFRQHFGKDIASFPPRAVLWDYIQGRVQKAGVRKWIRFSTPVRNVQFNHETKKFTVTVQDFSKKDEQQPVYSEVFDYVVVATGHFSTPNVPSFDGFDTFPGRILHAHDFRDACEFQDKRLLIIGTSYSAEDIASQCYKYGCKSLVLSYRTSPMQYKWPDKFVTVPLLTRVDGKTAHFKDGSTHDVDAIILCTGYKHCFPFLPDDLRLQTENRLWPLDLYQGVVWQANPQMFYLGMQDQFYTFNMFDAQAWYARDVMLGNIALPSLTDMQADSKKWRDREETLQNDHDYIVFQGDYTQALIDQTDYPQFDIKGVNQAFFDWEDTKHDNIMTFRDVAYKSLMTNTMAPVHHTPWMQAMDDSMEMYLQNKSPADEDGGDDEKKQ